MFVGRERPDGERMNFALHHLAERVVNHAVAGDGVLAGEGARNDGEAVMSAAALGAFMTDMQAAFVGEFEMLRGQRGQPRLYALRGIAHGCFSSTCFAISMACANTNTSIRPVPPKSLKLTQVSVE